MGEIGARLSDVVVFTSDNPRSERVESILEEMLVGVGVRENVHVIADRHQAIELAFSMARSGDVVVIAGKGHEQGQESGGTVTPFDDRDVAREILQSQGWAA
jgi:UDP-N-acetylmuramoyl-L-alanyl-D-glutamate--2,6-diaminopimelate ligase